MFQRKIINLCLLVCLTAGLLVVPQIPGTAQSSTNLTIYSDSLASGWSNWSWGSSINLGSSSPVQAGARSASVRYNEGWAGFYLHPNSAVSTSGFTSIRFWIHGGSAGGQRVVFAVNKDNTRGTALTLNANTWTQVTVSLSSLGNPASINDLWWQSTVSASQPVFYIDDVVLVRSAATATPTRPAPTATRPAATATPTRLAATATRPAATATAVAPVSRFNTLPPGSRLPSDEDCARLVRARPENKGVNRTANATVGGQRLATNFFSGGDNRANTEIGSRVTGNYTGTTDMILQWTACKWGLDEDIVRAQAAIESWWRQDTKGDWTTNAANCAPGHGLGVDGTAGQCPESWGILQNRYPYEQSAWPGMLNSTAFNADTAYAIWRACFEGYETWLNNVERGSQYAAGDAWGCVGRWYAGRWHTRDADDYVVRVRDYLNRRIWETTDFQQP